MSKFHTTVSRRSFIKGLGLGAAGLGAAAAAAPVFRDLDEVIASPRAIEKRPWWVSERDYLDSTMPVDWALVERVDNRNLGLARKGKVMKKIITPSGAPFPGYVYTTDEEWNTLNSYYKEKFSDWDPGLLGYGDIRLTAFDQAQLMLRFGRVKDGNLNPVNMFPKSSFEGRNEVCTPEDYEMPKWQGTPEENLRMMRSVVRFWGGSDVGVVPIESGTTEKLIYKNDGRGRPYVWENVSRQYETDEKLVIPTSYKNCLVWTWRQDIELLQRQSGITEAPVVWNAYCNMWICEIRMTEFLRGIGYGGIGTSFHPSGAFGVFSGLVEGTRMGTPFNHPKYGTSLRGVNRMLTDLPLPATKPIDFGGYEFCKSCGICADNCPFGAIQTGEPTWEHPSPWNGQGYLGWPADTSKCPHCPSCQGSCPFNSLEQGSAIHDLVRATVSTTSLFNGFFVNMENSFGYADKRDPRDWFDLERPTWGIDTRW